MPLRILVVDDDATTQTLLRMAFEAEGHAVECFGESPAALERLRDEPFDVLVTDFVMPDMDGMALIEASRAGREAMRCIVLTGLDGAREAHAPDARITWLAKPIDLDGLLAAVAFQPSAESR